jgi:hypothetical protein
MSILTGAEMKARNRTTALDSLSRFPAYYQALAFQKFQFRDELVFINVRSKNLDQKPPLFLWSLDRNCFISSLFPVAGSESFSLDIMDTESHRREFWMIAWKDGAVRVEKMAGRK